MRLTPLQDRLALAALTLTACCMGLGLAPLFDWDEINFAESAREMLVSGDWLRVQINYQPFWEKPPLFFWLQALCMRLFGTGEFAARLPDALAGAVTIQVLYVQGLRWRGQAFARLLSLLMLASPLPGVYFKSGIIDPVFNLFILLALLELLRFEQLPAAARRSLRDAPAWTAGFWIGLATLTKGPAALLVTLLIYGLYRSLYCGFRLPWRQALLFLLAWGVPVAGWYGLETLVHGPWFLREFFRYQAELFTQGVAGHEQPFYYHILVFLPGCFPMAAFAFQGMRRAAEEAPEDRQLRRFALLWFWTVMVLFSLATTKIIHYASLVYVPAAVLGALYLDRMRQVPGRWGREVWPLLILGLTVWAGGALAVYPLWLLRDAWVQLIPDPLAVATVLAPVRWTAWALLPGLALLAASVLALRWLRRRQVLRFVLAQAAGTLLFLNLAYALLLPNAARHAQGAPLDFFSGLAGKPVYVATAGYKSYLPYFYAQITPGDPRAGDLNWLAEGETDRDVYLATRSTKVNAAFLERFRQFERLYEADGFVFFRRRRPGAPDPEGLAQAAAPYRQQPVTRFVQAE